MRVTLLAGLLIILTIFNDARAADKVRIGVSNYNISNLTVGVAQTRGFFKQEGIDAGIIRSTFTPLRENIRNRESPILETCLLGDLYAEFHA